MCARMFKESVSLEKKAGRNTMYTINQKHQLLSGTDLPSLFKNGVDSIRAHVESKFESLPTRVVFRTDKKQEDVEELNTDQQEELMTGVVEEAEAILIPIFNEY